MSSKNSKKDYARCNVFVGAYSIPKDGWIRLPEEARVRLMRGIVKEGSWCEDPTGEVWLIIDDGRNFWPVMVRLGEKDDIVAALPVSAEVYTPKAAVEGGTFYIGKGAPTSSEATAESEIWLKDRQLEVLAKYAKHLVSCNVNKIDRKGEICDCGYEQSLAMLTKGENG